MCVEMVRRAPYAVRRGVSSASPAHRAPRTRQYVSLLNITSPRLIFPPPYPSQPSLSQLEHCIMRITKVQRSCEVVRSERTEPETGGAVRNELPRAFAIVGSGLVAFYCLAPTAVGAQNRLVETSALDVVTVHDSVRREFYFTRAVYSDLRTRFPSWSVDYPKADRQFLIGLQRLTNIDAYAGEHPVRLDDPALREFPILYAVEVGYMALTDSERQGLRDYLLAGGFLIVGPERLADHEAQAAGKNQDLRRKSAAHRTSPTVTVVRRILSVIRAGTNRSGAPAEVRRASRKRHE